MRHYLIKSSDLQLSQQTVIIEVQKSSFCLLLSEDTWTRSLTVTYIWPHVKMPSWPSCSEEPLWWHLLQKVSLAFLPFLHEMSLSILLLFRSSALPINETIWKDAAVHHRCCARACFDAGSIPRSQAYSAVTRRPVTEKKTTTWIEVDTRLFLNTYKMSFLSDWLPYFPLIWSPISIHVIPPTSIQRVSVIPS